MPRAVRGFLAALASCALVACSRQESAPSRADASADALAIRVPMPEGWFAQSQPDGSLRAGPAGRSVLRVERRIGAGRELPSPAELKRGFERELKPIETSIKIEKTTESATWVVLSLAPRGASGQEQFAMLGAKSAGGDLFLCATFPGAGLQDVQKAARSCEEISVDAADARRRD